MLPTKFGWKWPSGSGEEDKNDHIQFLHFCDYFPFEEGQALCLNKLESPSPKDDLCQVWTKLDQWFWKLNQWLWRRFLNIFSVLLSPLEKDRWSSYEQILIPSHQGWFVSSFLGWNWPSGSWEEDF
jgi:hypothetical protein